MLNRPVSPNLLHALLRRFAMAGRTVDGASLAE